MCQYIKQQITGPFSNQGYASGGYFIAANIAPGANEIVCEYALDPSSLEAGDRTITLTPSGGPGLSRDWNGSPAKSAPFLVACQGSGGGVFYNGVTMDGNGLNRRVESDDHPFWLLAESCG